MVVLFNTQAFDRFELIRLNLEEEKEEIKGNVMIDGLGHTLIDNVFLSKSSETSSMNKVEL